ncbi:SAC3/GANP family protein [Nitzschia inconspicua]|uniref:SAC3/GANP family protein n=1 Tax=Nitzschia inconspicua TaxID=303405 RepID=A0A9K3LM00_9STRA|nr:SAC3/GANP family protein [Nitzschia inconspicua]
MPPTFSERRKHKKKRPIENIAPIYKEDIGTEGLKTTGVISLHKDVQSFHVKVDKKEKSKRKSRMERFGDQTQKLLDAYDADEDNLLGSALPTSLTYSQSGIISQELEAPVRARTLVGTSTALEKPYMRLTTHPKAENVRPLAVLQRCLAHIKSKFIQNEDFEWANEQLKSVRQDITVQHLRCPFVLEVYETHARILLEHGDLNEFNQCQTMIRSLTSSSYGEDEIDHAGMSQVHFINDDTNLLRQADETADEFQAYRLLYDLVQYSWSDLGLALSQYATEREAGQNSCDDTYHQELPLVARGSSSRHALKVVKAVMHNDYQTFFRLYESAPHLSAYLMDFLVRRVRIAAYERIVAAYRPTISVEHFREVLVFHDLEETRRFLRKSGAVFVSDSTGPAFWVDCKASFAVLNQEEP